MNTFQGRLMDSVAPEVKMISWICLHQIASVPWLFPRHFPVIQPYGCDLLAAFQVSPEWKHCFEPSGLASVVDCKSR